MLSVFCCIACAVLVILDVTGKLHPERTRSQVLLHLFSLVGALVPLVATLLVPWFVDDLETLRMVRYLYTLPYALSFVSNLASLLCAATWAYTMVRICSCVPIAKTGSDRKQAAKQQLTMLWLSLPFFLLMLISGVILLVSTLSVWWMAALMAVLLCIVFLPAIVAAAVLLGGLTLMMALPLLVQFIALLHGRCLRQPLPHRLCALSGLEKAVSHRLAVLMFLPWIRWIVTLIVMSKMQNVK